MQARLSVITPTRRRWPDIEQQANVLLPQLTSPGDEWIIVVDRDEEGDSLYQRFWQQPTGTDKRIRSIWLSYESKNNVNCVNRARNLGSAVACQDYLVEIDDHDFVADGAISLVREAFENLAADYVFGDVARRVPTSTSNDDVILEPQRWKYVPGMIAAGAVRPLGLRAMRAAVWRALGGWQVWPGGDLDFAIRVERCGFRIVHIPEILSTITVGESDSIMHACRHLA